MLGVYQQTRSAALTLCAVVALSVAGGCASQPYAYGHFPQPSTDAAPQQVEVTYGQPDPKVDRLTNFVTAPVRLFKPNTKFNRVSPETVEHAKRYLEENYLTDVHVEVRSYEPDVQWTRLKQNDKVAPGWRDTLGMLSYLEYRWLPGRVWGYNAYDPWTNTLSINSDYPASVLHEAALAKDYHRRQNLGSYAALGFVPGVTAYRSEEAASDVLSYTQANHDWVTEEEAYEVVYPRVGAQTALISSPLLPFIFEPVLGLTGAAVGYGVGRMVESARESELEAAARDGDPVAMESLAQASRADNPSPRTASSEPVPAQTPRAARREYRPSNQVSPAELDAQPADTAEP